MAVTYYYGDPRQFQGYTSTLRDENSLLDYWFYPNRVYMEEVRKEIAKQGEENTGKKKGGGGSGGGDGGGGEGGGKKKGGGGGGDNKGGDNKDAGETKGGKKEADNKPKVIELKVYLCCEACARKMRKKIEKLDGVESGVITDMHENKVTVKATTKPETVLKQAQKVKKDTVMWPKKKEPEKKKEDNKKDDKNKNTD